MGDRRGFEITVRPGAGKKLLGKPLDALLSDPEGYARHCVRCGRAFSALRVIAVCLGCATAEEAYPAQDYHAERVLMGQLGVPEDAVWARVTFSPVGEGGGVSLRTEFPAATGLTTFEFLREATPAQWPVALRDVELEGFGDLIQGVPEGERLWPSFHLGSLGSQLRGTVVRAWLITVRRRRTPVRAELRWAPETGQSIAFVADSNAITSKAIEQCRAALGVLKASQEVLKPGRQQRKATGLTDDARNEHARKIRERVRAGYSWRVAAQISPVGEKQARKWVAWLEEDEAAGLAELATQ